MSDPESAENPNRLDFEPSDFGIGRLFAHVRDAVIVANAHLERIVLWNHCAETLFGYTESEALQLALHELVPAELRDRHRAGLARYQEAGTGPLLEAGRPVELTGLHKDGHEVPIELTLTAIPERTETGDRFALAIVRDITDRREAEAARIALREAELRQKQGLQLHDKIVQGLVVAKWSLEAGERDKAEDALKATLDAARGIVSELLETMGNAGGIGPGDLRHGDPPAV